ncbi:MAG: RDD family protein [Desulfocapsaceae bacterium]|nr:RDD family protein [Desulfocapsaceae bacterium]
MACDQTSICSIRLFAITEDGVWIKTRRSLNRPNGASLNILGIILCWIYFAAMESAPSQGTLGEMALWIKVKDLGGNKIGFGKATGRHFGKILSGIILGIGFIMVAFIQKKQGLHDIMAGSLVVNK